MYKKPVTEEILVDTKLMSTNLDVSGGTDQLGGNPVGNAPKKRDGVF